MSQEIEPSSSATLADVLYARSPAPVSENEWLLLVQGTAAGDQMALHGLYDRAHRVVFTLAMRITSSRETAEELTLDVFHDVWRRAGEYDPGNGTVLGWIMIQARSRALDRLRFDRRVKRADPRAAGMPHGEIGETGETGDSQDAVESKQQSLRLQHALGLLTPGERQAIETAFFCELTHAEVAERLSQPLGTVKSRIRSGLRKLRRALESEGGRQ